MANQQGTSAQQGPANQGDAVILDKFPYNLRSSNPVQRPRQVIQILKPSPQLKKEVKEPLEKNVQGSYSRLVTQLPEMVYMILGFLPVKDLISCTRVSRRWEEEARKHLLLQCPATLRLILCNYLEVVQIRGHCAASIDMDLRFAWDQDIHPLIPLLKNIADSWAHKVRHLSTDWLLDNSWSAWWPVWRLFTSLESLQLRPYLQRYPKYDDSDVTLEQRNSDALSLVVQDLSNLTPCHSSNFFPSVKTLIIQVHALDDTARAVLCRGLSIQILKMFPNLTTLKLVNLWDPFLPSSGSISTIHPALQNVDFLSLITEDFLGTNFDSLLSLPIYVTRIEFNFPKFRSFHIWEKVCSKLSSTLEQLTIRDVKNTRALRTTKQRPFWFPILPKLKVLKVFRSNETGYTNMTPSTDFKFETQRPSVGLRVNYPTQFPALVHLSIAKEPETRYEKGFHDGEEFDEYCFETEVSLLYMFIPLVDVVNGVPCHTLRHLDIPCPGRDRWRYTLGHECQTHNKERTDEFDTTTCDCWEWSESSSFLKWVHQMFPNAVVVNRKWNSLLQKAIANDAC